MAGESEEGNWLRAAHIACPYCTCPLFRVNHSPLADDWLLYCDKCANRAVVSYYDPVVTAIEHGMAEADRFEYRPLCQPSSSGSNLATAAATTATMPRDGATTASRG